MAYDYVAERASAHADLKADGATVVLSTTGAGTQDGATGKVTPGTTVVVNTYGLLKNYRSNEVDGTLVQKGDLQVLSSAEDLARLGLTPAAGWICAVMGTTYRVMDVQPIAPGGVAVLWRLQLRK